MWVPLLFNQVCDRGSRLIFSLSEKMSASWCPQRNCTHTVSAVLSSPPPLPPSSFPFSNWTARPLSIAGCRILRRICFDNKRSINALCCVKLIATVVGIDLSCVCVCEKLFMSKRETWSESLWVLLECNKQALWVAGNEMVRRRLMGYPVWNDPDDWLSMRTEWIRFV